MKGLFSARIQVPLLVVMLCVSMTMTGDALQSTNYRFDETTLGAGGQIEASSSNFKSSNSAGDIAVGESASANYQVAAGSQTTNDPRLAVDVFSTNAAFGTLSPSTASTATASFKVLNYTTYGYVVQLVGSTPTNGNYSLPGLTTGTASSPGSEQFGVNLVANTLPVSQGANPNNAAQGAQIFGFGTAAPNYASANQYRYVSGETIAQAPKNSGETTYTMSYIVNVKALSPGGVYSSRQSIVVTGTY